MSDPENTILMETSKGSVVIELRPDLAPGHVERINELAREGFYDGIVFHRVIDGFMAQVGCPNGTGMGGSDLPDLKAEFSEAPFRRGVLGLTARTARTDLAFSYSRTETDGFSASAFGTEDDGYEASQANLYFRHQITDIFAAGITALYIDSRAEFDEFGGDGAAPFDEFNETEATGDQSHDQATPFNQRPLRCQAGESRAWIGETAADPLQNSDSGRSGSSCSSSAVLAL